MRIRCTTLLVLTLVMVLPATAQVDALRHAPPMRPQQLNMQYHRAKTAFESGASLLEAKARVDIVLSELPDDAEARKLRAAILMALDKPDAAFLDAQRATILSPGDGEAHVLRCESGVVSGRAALANESLDTATDLIMGDVALYVRLSTCALELGQIRPAEALARLAMASGARDGRGHLQLARVFMRTGRAGSAETVLVQGLQERAVRAWDIRRDPLLAPLMEREGLAAWRRR
jgi:predicted Zn-dependent protease